MSATRDHMLIETGRRQHGVVSRDQALRLGFSDDEILNRVAKGVWSRVAPRVFDVAPASRDPRRALHAAVLSTEGLASHRSAAFLHGLIGDAPARPEVIVPIGHDRAAVRATVRRSTAFRDADRCVIDGIPATRVERTLVDLGAVVDLATLDEAVSCALRSGRTTLGRIEAAISPPQFGRRGVRALRNSLDLHRDHQGEIASKLEAIVARAVRRSGLPAPTRQFAIRVGNSNYRLDFAWPGERVYLEADGWARHVIRRTRTRDLVRQNALASLNWMPLRCTWEMATRDEDALIANIGETLTFRRGFAAA